MAEERCSGQFEFGCGQLVGVRREHLSASMLNGLRTCVQTEDEGRVFYSGVLKGLFPDSSEYSHFFRLKYWDFAQKLYDEEGKRVPKAWRSTKLGRMFLADEVDAPKTTLVARGDRVVGTEGRINVFDVQHVEITPESVVAEMLPHEPPEATDG